MGCGAGCSRRGQRHGGQPTGVLFGQPAQVDGDGHVGHLGHPEVRGHRLAQRCGRTPAVLGPDGPPQGGPAQAVTAAPAAGLGLAADSYRAGLTASG
jgi:hypothetical protein